MTTAEAPKYGRGQTVDPAVRALAERLEAQGDVSRGEISRRTGVSLTSLRKWLGPTQTGNFVTAHSPELREEIGRLVAAGWPYLRIERERGVTQGTLRRWFGPSHASHGVEFANQARARRARERYDEAVRLRMVEGKTNAEIAVAIGMSESRVYAQLGRTPERLGGSAPPAPEELKERARYLRTEYEMTIDEVAERMGRPRGTVWGWVKGTPVPERERQCLWCGRVFYQPLAGQAASFCIDNKKACWLAQKWWTQLQQARGPAVAAEYRERKLREMGIEGVEAEFDPHG